jgi:hypothetical protein
MTAEIAVMNKQGIALAADSAVTISPGSDPRGSKIYVSANKIFALSKFRPVAIMIYDSAEIMGLPWETVIKKYREHLGDSEFPRLDGYVEDFARFLGTNHRLFPAELQTERAEINAKGLCEGIFEAVHDEVDEALQRGEGPFTDADIKARFEAKIEEIRGEWADAERLPSVPSSHENEVFDRYAKLFKDAIKKVFEKVPDFSDKADGQLLELLGFCHSRIPPWTLRGTTGVVFAGFGAEDVFPSLREIVVDEVILDRLLYWPQRSADISRRQRASVVPFAQNEMVARFMAGVDPGYQQLLEKSFRDLMEGYTNTLFKILPKGQPSQRARKKIKDGREQMLAAYIESLTEARRRSYIDSVVDAVGVLPLTELAEMAESLVNLTSFKRKVSMEVESVSEPIDVAVISAGDGFIWINRKHYFAPEQNHHFFANYYRKDYGSTDGTTDGQKASPHDPNDG